MLFRASRRKEEENVCVGRGGRGVWHLVVAAAVVRTGDVGVDWRGFWLTHGADCATCRCAAAAHLISSNQNKNTRRAFTAKARGGLIDTHA